MKLKQIERLAYLESQATPGPWPVILKGNSIQSLAIKGVCSGMSPKNLNADFIAAAREAMPELLAAVSWTLTSVDLPPIGQKVLVEWGPHSEQMEGHREVAYRVQPEGSERWWWAGMETMEPHYILAWLPITERTDEDQR